MRRRKRRRKMPGQSFLRKEEAKSLLGRRGRWQKLSPWPWLGIEGEAEKLASEDRRGRLPGLLPAVECFLLNPGLGRSKSQGPQP